METHEHVRPWWLLPVGRLHPRWWIGIGLGLIWIDYLVGPLTQFPVLYVIPVSVAAWYSGRWPAVALAVIVPVVHIIFLLALWPEPGDAVTLAVATLFRGAIVVVMTLWFARLSEHERSLHRYVLKLEGLLPICAFCKSIRNEAGNWEPLERFISTHSDAQFSHCFCENCVQKQYRKRSV
jgi:hypothetical protein